MEYLYIFATFLAVFNTAESLQCWVCQSTEGGGCADYFNETVIRRRPQTYNNIDSQIPTQQNCDAALNSFILPHQRTVCIKRVETINGQKHYTRKCETSHTELPVGECSKEQQSDSRRYTDFCQQCDRDFCNTANVSGMKIWLLLIPFACILFLRK